MNKLQFETIEKLKDSFKPRWFNVTCEEPPGVLGHVKVTIDGFEYQVHKDGKAFIIPRMLTMCERCEHTYNPTNIQPLMKEVILE